MNTPITEQLNWFIYDFLEIFKPNKDQIEQVNNLLSSYDIKHLEVIYDKSKTNGYEVINK